MSDIPISVEGGDLFARVASILDQARANVVRAVNNQMVIAYWLIGREIVHALQGGEKRAGYGQRLIKDLAERLTRRYGRGFSDVNLKYFRRFYQAYADREPQIGHTACAQLQRPDLAEILTDMTAAIEDRGKVNGFSPVLSWSHYRALCTVENAAERRFYEIEAEKCGWSERTLTRQIHTWLFARLLKSQDKAGIMELAAKGQVLEEPADAIKHPYVLDFLGVPDPTQLHETQLEAAIIDNLQPFLLELGKGFAFIARQYRVATEFEHFYIDLVFYNHVLKCFLLIDLKTGRLTHQDVGQMDMYVRMFDDWQRGENDNPTVGLILCAKRNEVVAKYSVLKESRQLFASKYMSYLPTEEELSNEVKRNRDLIVQSRREAAEDQSMNLAR